MWHGYIFGSLLFLLYASKLLDPVILAGFNNVLFQQSALKDEIFANKYFCSFATFDAFLRNYIVEPP